MRDPRRTPMQTKVLGICLLLIAATGCGDEGPPANEQVRARIESLAPAANIGHRGIGPTQPGRPPENSVSSFLAAMEQGADGVELDVEITADGQIIVMHDDTLDRTTDCEGCVSEFTFDEVRACRLLDGNGQPTDERPPTLEESYDAVLDPGLVNVELKVFGSTCATSTTDASALVDAALAEVDALGVADRTFFSSFDETASRLVKERAPDYYSARLYTAPGDAEDVLAASLAAGLDAIHPFFLALPESVSAALDAGLQVNVWTVNEPDQMEANLDKGVTSIITDNPDVLREILGD
ncbi:MAG: glycerophosphodiester phosphodiesterase family protein [Myxococcota bacterium]